MFTALYFGVLIGVLVFTVFIHLQIAARSAWPRHERFFLGNAVATLVYAVLTWTQYHTDSVEAYVWMNRVQAVCAVAFFVCLIEFIYGKEGRGRLVYAWEAAFAAYAAIALFLPYGGAYLSVRGMENHVLPWGETIRLIDGEASPAYLGSLAFVASGMAIAIRGVLRGRGPSGGRRPAALLVSLGIIVGAILFDFAVAANQVRWIYLAETSYAVFALVTGFSITGGVIRVASLERALERSVVEKDILIKEIHHRVRNNLAVLSSLVRLQLGEEDDPGVKLRLGTTFNRIKSIAGVHDLAYDPQGVAEIDLGCYLDGILRSVADTFGKRDLAISSKMEPAGLRIPIDLAVPLGLIANEIFSNSVLHAWEGGRDQRIRYRAYLDGKILKLSISDNGKGWKEGAGAGPPGLGAKLIKILADQIDARVKMESSGGTAWSIKVDIKKERRMADLGT